MKDNKSVYQKILKWSLLIDLALFVVLLCMTVYYVYFWSTNYNALKNYVFPIHIVVVVSWLFLLHILLFVIYFVFLLLKKEFILALRIFVYIILLSFVTAAGFFILSLMLNPGLN